MLFFCFRPLGIESQATKQHLCFTLSYLPRLEFLTDVSRVSRSHALLFSLALEMGDTTADMKGHWKGILSYRRPMDDVLSSPALGLELSIL